MRYLKYILLSTAFLSLGMEHLSGQVHQDLLVELSSQEQEAVNALVLYPEEVRLMIFEAAQYPEVLVKFESIQSRTSDSFKALIEHEERVVQERLWDLARYPDLISNLVLVDADDALLLEDQLAEYPAIIYPRAQKAYDNDMALLKQIDQLHKSAENTYEAIVSSYPPEAQQVFHELKALPEILSILTEHIRLTIVAGDLYSKQPQWLLSIADSLHLEVARQNAEQLEEWKSSLEENQEVKNELEETATNYQADFDNDIYYDDGEADFYEHREYHHYHYPYWFGYPHWYSYPRWRCYPSWYYSGFYFSHHHGMIVINLPSYHFMHWYFFNPFHHIRYARLSSHFVRHYHGHRRSARNSISSSVNTWRQENRAIITDKWLKNDGNMTARFKEFGSFERDRLEYNKKHKAKTVTKEQFLESSRKYPSLKKSYSEQPNRKKVTTTKPRVKKEVDEKKPRKYNDKNKIIPPKPEPRNIPATQDKRPAKKREPRKETPKVDLGKDYHKYNWDRANKTNSKPSLKQQRPKSQQPAPRRTNVKPKTKRKN